MRTHTVLSLALVSLAPSGLHAEEQAFHNILSVSRSIMSPSQYYQVREGGLFEAHAGYSDGSLENKSSTSAIDTDVQGSSAGAAGFIAVNPSLLFAVKAENNIIDLKQYTKSAKVMIRPAVVYSPIPELSLAAQVNFLRGTVEIQNSPKENANANNFTFGMTAHQATWEATAVLSTKKESDDEDIDDLPQEIGLHARYHLIDPITLGVSYEQTDLSGIAGDNDDVQDQTRLGVHMESAMSEMFAIEVDYFSTTHESGAKDQDGSEFVLLGQALLTPTLEAGAKISYLTVDGNGLTLKLVSPGIFIAARF